MISFLEYLAEATTPFGKRLEWLVNNERDPVVAFLAIDIMMLPPYARQPWPRGGSYLGASSFAAAKKELERDVRSLMLNGDTRSDDEVKTKLLSMLKDYITRGVWYNSSAIPDRSPWEKMAGWVALQVRRGDWQQLKVLRDDGSYITDWFSAVQPKPDLMALTPLQARDLSRQWHTAIEMGKEVKATNSLEKMADLSGGVEIYRLQPDDLDAEGAAMQHCIGKSPEYARQIQIGRATAYSIRRNKKRLYTVYVTAEKQRNSDTAVQSIQQFKGKANTQPGSPGTDVDAFRQSIEWFRSKGILVDQSRDTTAFDGCEL